MDRNELLQICTRWAKASRKATDQDAAQFAAFYADTYPNGNAEMPRVFDYQDWKR